MPLFVWLWTCINTRTLKTKSKLLKSIIRVLEHITNTLYLENFRLLVTYDKNRCKSFKEYILEKEK